MNQNTKVRCRLLIANRFRFAVSAAAAAATTVLPVYCSFVVLTIYEGKGRRPSRVAVVTVAAVREWNPLPLAKMGREGERGREAVAGEWGYRRAVGRSGRVCFGSAKTQPRRLNVPRILVAAATCRAICRSQLKPKSWRRSS